MHTIQRGISQKPPQLLGALVAGILGALLALPSLAGAMTIITFDDQGFEHGEIVNSASGVTIVANQPARPFDYAVVFDSEETGTADRDLEALRKTDTGETRWSGGNLVGEQLDLMLILQENDIGCDDGVCDSPDDDGNRPAGTISFLFDVPVLSFGFDLIDVDSKVTENGAITFTDVNGAQRTIDFATLLSGFEVGDHFANRIDPLTAELLELGPIGEVEILLGGSGALDNIAFQQVPEPTSLLLVGLGLAVLGGAARRRAA